MQYRDFEIEATMKGFSLWIVLLEILEAPEVAFIEDESGNAFQYSSI